MKLDKNMFSCWNGNEYDNELIITHTPRIRSVEMADYILQCQTKADEYDMLLKIASDLTARLKKCEENSKDWERIANVPEWDITKSARDES